MAEKDHSPEQVLDLWFPQDGHWEDLERHRAFWTERLQGGMDARIIADFADLTQAAAQGHLDDWAETPRGRLALLIALDQFPRSLWRDTPAAYAQDIKAARLALEGIGNGDFDQLRPWEQTFFMVAISHCEGPDHFERMQRMDPVVERICTAQLPHLAPLAERLRAQHARVKAIVARFGRHPHRNAVLGRPCTPDEQAYIAEGDFPHLPQAQPSGST